jgi:hypothetical protein
VGHYPDALPLNVLPGRIASQIFAFQAVIRDGRFRNTICCPLEIDFGHGKA